MGFMFIFNSALLGVGLAMDAFSVSLANGLNEPKMSKRKVVLIAGMFAFFQALMPLIGWVFVHNLANAFKEIQKFIPYIALVLLVVIGSKMLLDGIKTKHEDQSAHAVGFLSLIVQSIATSIDALSVGFTISNYFLLEAVLCAVIIAAVTFVICFAGVLIGKKFGTRLSKNAQIFGGAVLIAIGIEIFITSL